MSAEFDWWLLILGLVVGAGLVWLILAELPRRDEEVDDPEVEIEAGWIAAQLGATDRRVDRAVVLAVLRAHRAYLHLPPPDEPVVAVSPAAPAVSAAPAQPDEPVVAVSPAAPAVSAAPAQPDEPLVPPAAAAEREPVATAEPAAAGSSEHTTPPEG